MSSILKVIAETTFKQDWSVQGSSLANEKKLGAKKGDLFSVIKITYLEDNKEKNPATSEEKKDYWYVQFEKPLQGQQLWYVYRPHVEHWDFGKKLK